MTTNIKWSHNMQQIITKARKEMIESVKTMNMDYPEEVLSDIKYSIEKYMEYFVDQWQTEFREAFATLSGKDEESRWSTPWIFANDYCYFDEIAGVCPKTKASEDYEFSLEADE